MTPQGNFERKSILFLADPSVDVDAAARAALLEARDRRPQPLRDDKALAAWNGLALAAFAEAGARLDRADYVDYARALAEFLLGTLSDGRGRLLRTFRDGVAKIDGYLEDYANVAHGLVELCWATGELRWLEEARRLADLALELFADRERGGFYFDSAEGATLVARRKEFDDHPTPSGNSMIAHVLLRLARIYGEDELEREAVAVFRLARPFLERAPAAVGHMLCALDLHFAPPREIAVVGRPDDARTEDLRRALLASWEPDTVYAFSSGSDDEGAERIPLLAGRDLVDGRPAAYVCERFACRAPVTSVDDLRAALVGAT